MDVDAALSSVAIPGRILNEIFAHALESLPEECCGLIMGDEHERFVDLVRCRNEMTQRHRTDPASFPLDGRAGFYMSESDYLRAREQAESECRRVTAVYHSHVGTGAYLSELDLEYAENEFFPFPQADQIVVSVADQRVDAAGIFQRTEPGGDFRGRSIAFEAP